MANTIKIKRGSSTPTALSYGELGIVTGTNKLYVGDSNGKAQPVRVGYSESTAAHTHTLSNISDWPGVETSFTGESNKLVTSSAILTAIPHIVDSDKVEWDRTLGPNGQYEYWVKNVVTDGLGTVGIANGGTGATTALNAIQNLGIYPVGSIYMSTSSTSPAELFGGGWEPIKDTFLLAAGDTYSAASTGGEATHTLTESEAPAKTWSTWVRSIYYSSDTHSMLSNISNVSAAHTSTSSWNAAAASSTYKYHTVMKWSYGSGGAHNNMPPYYTVYMWYRYE